jgi:hypothetical protein
MFGEKDPWVILGGGSLDAGTITGSKGATVAISIFNLLKIIGLIGLAITLVIAIIKFSTGNANVRAEAKQMMTKKIVLSFFIFTAAYFFGWALSIIATL